MEFTEWMVEVNREVTIQTGLSAYDLADRPYRDMYDDGFTPREAAHEALEYEGFPLMY